MRQLNQLELRQHLKELQFFLDTKVQKFFISEHGLGIEFFQSSQMKTLWFDMYPQNPCLLLFDGLPSFLKLKKTSPIFLFLKAHFTGKRLTEITHLEEWGRVIRFQFGYEEALDIEVRLFPHGENMIARFEDKKISLHKVKPLEKFENSVPQPGEVRSLKQFTAEWIESKKGQQNKKSDPAIIKEKEIQKKQKALLKIEEQIQILNQDSSRVLGDWLKTNQSLKAPKQFAAQVDLDQSLAWNIQHSYDKAKKVKEKLQGAMERQMALKNEIVALEKAESGQFHAELQEKFPPPKKESNWKGYRFPLNDKVDVYVGKNATENLQILRYAQSWDMWLHLKDYPGAHGIIKRPRNLQITDDEIKEVAHFVAAKSKKSVHFLKSGDSFEIICVECRFVRPIKGDKLGRVTYSNERVLLCHF